MTETTRHSKSSRLEEALCGFCGSDQSEAEFEGRDLLLEMDEKFRMVKCSNCGSIYQNPRPTPAEMENFYPAAYMPFVPAIAEETSWFRRLDRWYGGEKKYRAVKKRTGNTGRLLDVGCATGVFLDAMRRHDWIVTGVEPNQQAATYARNRLGLDVFEGTLEEAKYPDNAFDVVTLWDVLEHVHSPRATLFEVFRILSPGGWLIFSVPDPESIEAKIFGRYWAGFDLPRHLHIFQASTIERLLNDVGLHTIDRSYFTGRFGVLVLSVEFWLNAHVAQPKLRGFLSRLMRSLPMRILFLPYYTVADRLHQSSIVTFFAKKDHDA